MSRTARARTAPTRNGSPTPRELVRATRTPDIVDLPKRRCLAIDGAGSPADPGFAQAIAALYRTAYALKFARKRAGEHDFKVGPLEGHWSADVRPGARERPPAESWRWRLRLGVPSDVTKDDVDRLRRDVVAKVGRKAGKLAASPLLARVFLESIPAQRVGRILHLGPYADEPASFDLIAPVLERAGFAAAPSHVEVYLNEPSRTRPAGLKTVLLRELAAPSAA
jgi:hypothetical protein